MSLLKHLLKYAYERHGRYGYHDSHHDGYGPSPDEPGYRAIPQAGSAPAWLSKTGRRLIYIVAIVAIILLVAAAVLLLMLVPLAIDAIDFLYRNGISGVMDLLSSIIGKLWKGAGSQL